jgi:hypothetical protein
VFVRQKLTDALWIEDVTSRLQTLLGDLDGEEVRPLVTDLARRPDWRSLSPEDATARAIDELEPPEGR